MYVGCIRSSYLILIGLVLATLLFYAAYISTSPFIVRLTSSSHHQVPNESAVVEIAELQNHSDIVNDSSKVLARNSSSVSTLAHVLPPAAQTHNVSVSTVDLMAKGILAQNIYESGHVEVNSNICPDLGNSLQLLIMVTSAPNHTDARMAVRQTWGHFQVRRDVSIAFMLGSTTDVSLQAKLNNEDFMYGDIIQGKFLDTYDNLTLKTISMLEWVDNYCPNVAFVLKTDDDMFINVPKLLTMASKYNHNDRIIYGRLAKKWKPIRNKKSKYYISLQQYKPRVFPDFTTGPAYLIPSSVIHDLYLAALNHTYFKLEDVFVTGIVAHSINVKRVHVNEFLNKRISFNPCNVQKGISIHMVKYSEQFDLWKKLLDGRSKCK